MDKLVGMEAAMKKSFRPGCFILVILVLVIVGGFFVFPDLRQQSDNSDQHFIISIHQPVDQGRYPAFQQIPIETALTSEFPITRLELWANGEIVDEFTPLAARTSALHTWKWVPPFVGKHDIFVRAYDFQGHSSESNVVTLFGTKPVGYNLMIQPDNPISVETIAGDYGSSAAAIREQNPLLGMESNGLISAGQWVAVPVNPWAEATEGNPATPSGVIDLPAGTENSQVVAEAETTGSGEMPSPPELKGGVDACMTQLLITDTSTFENGFHVYRHQPNTNTFIQVATLAERELAGALLYEEVSFPGSSQYYVTAFSDAGEAASNIVEIATPDSCLSALDIMPIADLVDGPVNEGSELYFYYEINGGDWQRYPGNDQAFLNPSATVDLGLLAADHNSGDNILLGEAWTWDSGTLEFLGLFGMGSISPPDYAQAVVPSAGLMAQSTLQVRNEFFNDSEEDQAEGLAPISLCDQGSLNQFGQDICVSRNWDTFQIFSELKETTFRWTAGTRADMGIWQISLNPFPADQQLDPPGVIMSGKTFGAGISGLEPGQEGVFTIDLSQVNLDKIVEAAKQSDFNDTFQAFQPYSPPWEDSLSLDSGPAQALGINSSQAVEVLPAEIPEYNNIIFGDGLRRVYVRIIPIKDGQPAGWPSNQNIVYWNPDKFTATNDEIDYQVRVDQFYHAHLPERGLEFCIQVTGVDFEKMQNGLTSSDPFAKSSWLGDVDAASLYGIYLGHMQAKTPLCPQLHEPESMGFWDYLSDAFGKIKDAWDYVAKAYNYVTATIDEWAVALNPLCIQGQFVEKLVDEDGKKVEESCKVGTSIARSAAMASVGLPPSLPTSEQLEEDAKDYAIDMAAEQAGVECNADCKKVIKDEIDTVVEQYQENEANMESCINSEWAKYKGFEPMCVPPGVSWIPYPAGQFEPAVAVIEVTRPPTPPEGIAPPGQFARGCNLNVALVPIQNDFWVGKIVNRPANISSQENTEGAWTGQSIPFSQVRALHEPQTLPVPVLNPGESMLIPVKLPRSQFDYTLPGTKFLNLGRDYWIEYHGMTYQLEVSCGYYSTTLAYPDIPPSIVPYFLDVQWQEVQP